MGSQRTGFVTGHNFFEFGESVNGPASTKQTSFLYAHAIFAFRRFLFTIVIIVENILEAVILKAQLGSIHLKPKIVGIPKLLLAVLPFFRKFKFDPTWSAKAILQITRLTVELLRSTQRNDLCRILNLAAVNDSLGRAAMRRRFGECGHCATQENQTDVDGVPW